MRQKIRVSMFESWENVENALHIFQIGVDFVPESN